MAGIYIHIPFCKQACNYCNFHFSTSLNQKEELLQAIHHEIVLQASYLQGQEISTIYFGGGTPSLLQVEELKRLFAQIEKYFPNQNLVEVTIEVNPDDVNTKYLKELKSTPVNRFSMGVQSFRNEDLQLMNRAHNASEADYAVKAAQDAGFENISIDLIYGIPGLSNIAWKQNIEKTLSLHIAHISAYALTVEPRTVLAHQISKGKIAQPDTAQAVTQFDILMESLTAQGYDHYEISNFALPLHLAIHNTSYWQGAHYLGLGPSAHSFNGNSRQWNIANNALYIKSILKEDKVLFEKENLSLANQLNEYIMTALRTMWGLDLHRVAQNFDTSSASTILLKAQTFLDNESLSLKDNHLVLTNKGKHFADGIAAELFFETN